MIDSFPRRPAFTTAKLDRATELRENEEWIKSQRSHADTRYVTLWRNRCLVTRSDDQTKALLLNHTQIHPLDDLPHPPTLLGRRDGTTYFGVTVGEAMATLLCDSYQAEFADLRQVIDNLDAMDAGTLAYAKAMHYWQHRHTFCGVCGSRNRLRSAGHRMRCTNPDCARDTFPRIDPAIIVLVTHGDACLLGRGPGWQPRRYSTLAGFVEPGESLEEAVMREVYEESGVRLKNIRYRSSQPWPFPASAMAGFHAEAIDRALTLDDELEDAIWVTAEEIRQRVSSGDLLMPTPYSIAFGLISEWYQQQTGQDPNPLRNQTAWRSAG